MENIKYFGRAFAAEGIKIKNTLGLWSAFLFPLLIVFMNFMIFASRPQMMEKVQGNLWYNYTNNSLMIWTIVFMPLFIGIITFYINYNEHKNNAWRHVYSLPVPKFSIFLAKFFMSLAVVAVSMLFFYIANYITVKILAAMHPEFPFNDSPITFVLPLTFLKIFLASAGIIALQFVISIIFQNFLIPLGFSVLATFTAMFLLRWENIVYYPYAYPFFAAQDLMKGSSGFFVDPVLFSFIFALPVFAAGYYLHKRMRVK